MDRSAVSLPPRAPCLLCSALSPCSLPPGCGSSCSPLRSVTGPCLLWRPHQLSSVGKAPPSFHPPATCPPLSPHWGGAMNSPFSACQGAPGLLATGSAEAVSTGWPTFSGLPTHHGFFPERPAPRPLPLCRLLTPCRFLLLVFLLLSHKSFFMLFNDRFPSALS